MYSNAFFTHPNEPEKEIKLSENIPNFSSMPILTKIWIKGGRKSGKVISALKFLTLRARSDKGLEHGGWTFMSPSHLSASWSLEVPESQITLFDIEVF